MAFSASSASTNRPPAAMSGFFHVLNPSAAERRAVERFFAERRWPHIWIDRQSHPTHLETVINWATVEKRRCLAIWGGDGTLGRAANALLDLDALDSITLAPVPAGTCNDFARRLGLRPWRSWVDRATSEPIARRYDLGLVETPSGRRAFVNNAGFGRPAAALGRRRSRPLKDIAALAIHKVDVRWKDGGRDHFESREALFGMAFNAPYFSGGLRFDPTIDPADGHLTCVLEGPSSKAGLLLRFLRGRLGGSLSGASTFRVETREMSLHADREVFPQADGDQAFSGPVRQLQWSVQPGRLALAIWPQALKGGS